MGVTLRRFRPTASDPWDQVKAAHLLNRAGFGGTPEEVARLAALPVEAAVEELLNFESVPESFPAPDFTELHGMEDELRRLRRDRAPEAALRSMVQRINRANIVKFQELRRSWVRRMIETRRPLQEKLVLFWHGHLVSGLPETRVAEHMAMQLELFRRMAAGNFKELILAVSRDPAMLSYLDNNTNRKGKPNENYARELLELFTMGVGHYTEQDVREAARAFTGWTFVGNEFVFRRDQHDDGVKTFLGRTGNWDGTDIIDIIFEHPATARFLPRKLWAFFAYPSPEESVVEALAAEFRRQRWEIKPVLRMIFLSEAFFSPQAIRSRIKSPAELVVGAVRLTGATVPDEALVRAMDLMGQRLLYPPNVGGWPQGRRWINTATVLVRYNLGGLLLYGTMPGMPRRRAAPGPVDHLLDADRIRTAGDVVDQLVARFLQSPLDGRRRWALLRAFGTNREDTPWRPDGVASRAQLRSAAHLIMSMPEFQLH
ncbi:MAG: DUF1800 domain-containing protein [Armatimonadota bacterium]|nr:DUF1800 domain-containing protein [Armatimonadota bacterium]MDR7450689.1 DUF1800 domain-containing protein [Armatimonadota bacterium]MDR7466045.1 DUF1800 domain-containing protein [Armatimonadota bacterium]MDR7493918.1 DUF1800 domain-containing protein [Armatimonadota bacterium]MDR7504023.1 DUF1800 domain-containing protein [Armatimonadota bacterium]